MSGAVLPRVIISFRFFANYHIGFVCCMQPM